MAGPRRKHSLQFNCISPDREIVELFKDVEVTTKRKMDRSEEDEEEDDSDAFYSFQTDVDDAIKDGLIQRQETRAGKQVSSSLWFSSSLPQLQLNTTNNAVGIATT